MDFRGNADEDPDAEPDERTNDQENPQRPAVPRQRHGVPATPTAARAGAGNGALGFAACAEIRSAT
jgi:hypothetical protein